MALSALSQTISCISLSQACFDLGRQGLAKKRVKLQARFVGKAGCQSFQSFGVEVYGA